MSEPALATFTVEGSSQELKVHFNPAALQLTVANKLGPSKSKDKKGGRQVVSEASAKLALELVFDTTGTLENVCDTTVKVAQLMGDKGKPAPQVTFSWGAFRFTGVVDSYKETLEYFSADGIPLRATVSLGMTREEAVFERGPQGRKAAGWSGGSGASEPAQVRPPPGRSTTDTATQAGAPAAGRALAAQNGEESMRFPQSPSMVVEDSVPLSPPAAFASGGPELSAAQGSFGLRTPVARGIAQLDTERFIRRVETTAYSTSGSSFDLGGRVLTRGGQLSLSSRSRLRFEEE